MSDKLILEMAVETVRAAQAAERLGADRIELCADLRNAGVTPGVELMLATRAVVKIPIHAMIRPRPGDFTYTKAEVEEMRDSIEVAHLNEMDGIVLGVLNINQTVNVEVTKELIQAAHPLPVTFHRAFDLCTDKGKALEDCICAGAKRILTSGGATQALLGLATLKTLIEASKQRILIMPGGGINPDNLRKVRKATGATEFHSGLGTVLDYGSSEIPIFEEHVRRLLACLDRHECTTPDSSHADR